MHLIKEVEGTPIYTCETPASKYREVWRMKLCEEIAHFIETLPKGILLRGSHTLDLDLIAQRGTDRHDSSLTYVVPYHDVISTYYPFGMATTAMLIYQSSGLVELEGDADAMGVDSNRYQFIVPPKEALLGIIDIKEVRRISKRLRSLDREIMQKEPRGLPG